MGCLAGIAFFRQIQLDGLSMLGGTRAFLKTNHLLEGASMHEVDHSYSSLSQTISGRAPAPEFKAVAR